MLLLSPSFSARRALHSSVYLAVITWPTFAARSFGNDIVARRCAQPSSVAPASRRNCYGDIIGRARVWSVHDTSVLHCAHPVDMPPRETGAEERKAAVNPPATYPTIFPLFSFIELERIGKNARSVVDSLSSCQI